jgi:Raf kinase inhibitor-like YbhB/YbcL family protein
MTLEITSSVFSEGEMIPTRYTCDGPDVSPAETAQSLALICDDPDAPMGTWVHWVLFNIPAGASGLPTEISSDATLENGARHGTNDFGRLGYGGPCPPGGTHRYFFKLYALDTELDLASGISKAQLLKAMEGHILAEAQLMGKYKR